MNDFTSRGPLDAPAEETTNQSTSTNLFEDAYSRRGADASNTNNKSTRSADTQYKLSELIGENSSYMPLAIDLIEDVANGGLGSKSAEVSGLYEAERFQLVHDMHDIAKQFNDHFELVPGEDVGALVVEAHVINDTENVVDIDIITTVGTNDSARQERIDLYNPSFWPGEILKGKAPDVLQALDERTYQYEQLVEAMIEYDYNRLNNDWVKTGSHVNFIESNRANFEERAADQMIKELYRKDDEFADMRELYRSDDEYWGNEGVLKKHLARNADNPWVVGNTRFTSPLFDVTRFQRYPSKDLENLIHDLNNAP